MASSLVQQINDATAQVQQAQAKFNNAEIAFNAAEALQGPLRTSEVALLQARLNAEMVLAEAELSTAKKRLAALQAQLPPSPEQLAQIVQLFQDVTLDLASIEGGNTVRGQVRFSQPLPAATKVALATTDAATTSVTPTTVDIAAGRTAGEFSVNTTPVTGRKVALIQATIGSATKTAALTVTPPPAAPPQPGTAQPTSVTLSSTSVRSGETVNGTINFASALTAPANVVLTSSRPAIAAVPSIVSVPSGASSATFSITTQPVDTSSIVDISATGGGVSKTTALTVQSEQEAAASDGGTMDFFFQEVAGLPVWAWIVIGIVLVAVLIGVIVGVVMAMRKKAAANTTTESSSLVSNQASSETPTGLAEESFVSY